MLLFPAADLCCKRGSAGATHGSEPANVLPALVLKEAWDGACVALAALCHQRLSAHLQMHCINRGLQHGDVCSQWVSLHMGQHVQKYARCILLQAIPTTHGKCFKTACWLTSPNPGEWQYKWIPLQALRRCMTSLCSRHAGRFCLHSMVTVCVEAIPEARERFEFC